MVIKIVIQTIEKRLLIFIEAMINMCMLSRDTGVIIPRTIGIFEEKDIVDKPHQPVSYQNTHIVTRPGEISDYLTLSIDQDIQIPSSVSLMYQEPLFHFSGICTENLVQKIFPNIRNRLPRSIKTESVSLQLFGRER